MSNTIGEYIEQYKELIIAGEDYLHKKNNAYHKAHYVAERIKQLLDIKIKDAVVEYNSTTNRFRVEGFKMDKEMFEFLNEYNLQYVVRSHKGSSIVYLEFWILME